MGLYAPEPPSAIVTNRGADATAVLSEHGCTVLSVYCTNANAGARWLQLRQTATVPAASDPLLASDLCFQVPGSGSILIGADFFTDAGITFAPGLAFAFSTSPTIYTAGTASEQQTTVVLK